MLELINELEQHKVSVFLDEGELNVSYSSDELNPDLLSKIKDNKQEIIAFLQKYTKTDTYLEIPVAEEQENYPLSSSQYRIWLQCSSEEVSIGYNVPNHYSLKGSYNIEFLKRAILSTVDRHETLRTVFKEDEEGNIKQWILKREALNFAVKLVDYRGCSNALDLIKEDIEEDRSTIFDLEKGPLIRATIYQLAEDHLILYFNIHHIISDTWSLGVLAKDVLAYYEAFIESKIPDLQPLSIQYKDYAIWHEDQNKNQKNLESEAYWLNKFGDEVPVLDLPSSSSRPKIKTYNGLSLETYLSEEVTSKLKNYCQAKGISLYMGLLAVWNVLLYRYTGLEDITIGTAVAGRDHLDLKNQIGCFINTLALRNKINPQISFNDFCERIKNDTLDAYEHQTYPFDMLVKKLNKARDLGRGMLFDIMFLLQNSADNMSDENISQQEVSSIISRGKKATVSDIDITVWERGKHLKINLVYNVDVYDNYMAEGMLLHFKQLLNALLETPGCLINEIEYLSKTELDTLLKDFNSNQIKCPDNKTVVELFEEQAEKFPKNIALEFEEQVISYKELNERSNRLAYYLKEKYNVGEDELVGIKLEKSEKMLIAILGILKSGAAYLPIDLNNPEERVEFIEKDSNCRVVLDEQEVARFREIESKYSNLNPGFINSSKSLAYVIYTSGSTGKPKGVMIEHDSIVNLVYAQKKEFNITEDEKILQFSNYAFDASVEQLFLALSTGATLILPKSEDILDPAKLSKLIEERDITHVHATPSYLNTLKELENCKNIRRIIAGGEFCSMDLAKRMSSFVDFYNEYGPTETTVTSIEYKFNATGLKVLPIGRPISNTNVYILSDNHKIQPIGIVGELCIGGEGLARGYLNRPDLTNSKFIPNPFSKDQHSRIYKTGDLARWLPDGNIEFIGRKDDQVKIRGYRIELKEIENVLLDIPMVEQACVLVKGEDKILVSYIVGTNLKTSELKKELSKFLPSYMIPNNFVFLEEIPLTNNGKVDTKALLSLDKENEFDNPYVAPETDNEKLILQIAKQVLDIDEIGILNNFYGLGGDSIKSIQLISKLKQIGYQIKTKDIFEALDFKELAARIVRNTKEIDQKIVVGDIPLTPIQLNFFTSPSFKTHHHFNQSVILKSALQVDNKMLEFCLENLTTHHDALRITYKKEKDVWTQYNHDTSNKSYSIEFYDLQNTADALKKMNQLAQGIQSSFDLENGPLFKVGHFRLSDGDRIALIVHHLVIDGVSWRVILEDLSLLIEQYQSKASPKLPLKTDSYQAWSKGIKEYADSDKITEEKTYWQQICDADIPVLPMDLDTGRNIIYYDTVLSFSLNKSITTLLQKGVHNVHQTDMNDLLLSALGKAIRDTFNVERTVITLEGHGREEILEGIDVSRTVGWFTSIFPFILEASCNNSIDTLLKVKEDLNTIPNKGIGYGILKHLTDIKYKDPKASIEFNYLGDFGSSINSESQSILEYGSEDIGDNVDSSNGNEALLSVLGLISNDQLTLSIRFSQSFYYKETIEALIKKYKFHLENVIQELAAIQAEKQSNSYDYDNRIYDDGNNGLIPVSASQKNFIPQTQAHGIIGPVKISNFLIGTYEKEFRDFLKSHPSLRISFERENDNIFQRIIAADEVELGIKIEHNFQESSYEEMERIASDYFHEPYDLFQGELIRLFIVPGDNEGALLFMSIHHTITDMISNLELAKKIQDYYDKKYVPDSYMSNFDFVKIQNDFLESDEAKNSKRFWNDKLTKSLLKNKTVNRKKYTECIKERVLISGELLEDLITKVKQLRVPLNAKLMALHQELLLPLRSEGKSIQSIIVDGREQIDENVNMNTLIGVVSNFLPVPVLFSKELNEHENIISIYQDFMEARQHQNIPYTVIRSDFMESSGIDIENNLAGIFNFQLQENVEVADTMSTRIITNYNTNDYTAGVDLICIKYKNALEIILTTHTSLREKYPMISLKNLIKKNIDILQSIDSY